MLKWLLKWFSAHPMAHVPDITVERPSDASYGQQISGALNNGVSFVKQRNAFFDPSARRE
jgi:hypothetical protein